MQNPRKINLCGRCADILRDRYILKVEERQCNKDIKCELCKKVRFGGTYTMIVRKEH